MTSELLLQLKLVETNPVPVVVLQGLEFDLKGSSLDPSSFISVVVKDYETIGKDKYVHDPPPPPPTPNNPVTPGKAGND